MKPQVKMPSRMNTDRENPMKCQLNSSRRMTSAEEKAVAMAILTISFRLV